jgi:uncharacterized iron-regulated membrane protein
MVNKAKFQRYIRKSHRYLGLILGIQFLFWTLGGLYFSWTNIDEIRGDSLRRKEDNIDPKQLKASLADVLAGIQADSVVKVSTVSILGQAHYQLFISTDSQRRILLADAQSGSIREPLSESEAVLVAKESLRSPSTVVKTERITSTNGHHEYREKPLPAYAITFDQPASTTVYVSAELGSVQSFRNNQWRIFDFLWMLHVMDFESRDNINNWLLRAFSVFGLITLLSGFTLYFVTSRKIMITK